MSRASFAEVRQRCAQGRFFPYDDWRDRLFVPPAIVLVWVFVRVGASGSFVSWLSGAIAVVGGIGLSQTNPMWVFVGSFGYLMFYLLDYVDGGVARYRGEAGMGGQYLDWVIHVIAAVATMAGLAGGALQSAGFWIFPFCILALIASALTTARFSMGWFAICMERQQRRAKGGDLAATRPLRIRPLSLPYKLIRRVATMLFHENYAIFLLPALATIHLLAPQGLPDFRTVLVLVGGTVYVYVMVAEVQRLVTERRIDEGYHKLFDTMNQPKLPEDHFFG